MVSSLLSALTEREETKSGYFTVTEELLAQILEMLSIIRAEAWVGKVDKRKVPEMVHVPRPGQEEPVDTTPVLTPREFALMTQVG